VLPTTGLPYGLGWTEKPAWPVTYSDFSTMIERVRVGFSTLTNHQMNDALSSPLTITDATSDADGPSRIKHTERGTTTGNKRRSLVEQQNMSKSRVL
jgi:hypothetical protein